MAVTTIDTPAGPFTVLAAGDAVLASGFTGDVAELRPLVHTDLRTDADADVDLITKSVRAYFDGDITAIDAVPVHQKTLGGDFMAHAWNVLRCVTAGDPVTYSEYASRAGRPTAIRAAASACARNAAALFVPCHRVVRTDGSMGGYRWGIDKKEFLLAFERQITETHS